MTLLKPAVSIGPSGKFYTLGHVAAFWGDEEKRAVIQIVGSAHEHYEVFDSAQERTEFLTELADGITGLWNGWAGTETDR